MKWSTKNDELCVGPAAEWGRCDTCDVNGVLPSSTQSRAGFQNRTFPVERLFPLFFFYDSSFAPHLIIIRIESFHWIFFCVCRVCSLKKISGLPFVAALRRETVLGNENELMIVGCISWTQNAICPSKWTIGCLSKAIESRSLSLPFCTGLQHFIHFIRWNDPAVPKSFKHFRSLTT